MRGLKQFGMSFLIALSLFVSSIAACSCAHHQADSSDSHAASCHQTMTHESNRAKD